MNHRPFAYFDTSAWVKLYVHEKGSIEGRDLAKSHQIISSAILLIESFSALSRKKALGEMDGRQFNKLIRTMKTDVNYIELITVSDFVLDKSQEIVLDTGVRPLDAIHIASARIFQTLAEISIIFITSDRKQHEIAQRVGLRTVFVG